ncbi:MAG: type 4a pilus biogenesis protein PilO [Elusimicrobia bacterium]|nr:type 4a pilus biogenesis protein PilO [Elusimicrobiota bacterium]
MALSKQQQQQIVMVVMFVAGFSYVYWNYLLKPTNAKITKLDTELTRVLDEVETMKRTANRLPALQREFDDLNAQVGQAEKRLPKEKNLEEVLRIVTTEAIKHHVSILSFSPGTERPQNYFIEIPINLSFQGQFHTLGKFLSVLGQQERILAARNVQVTYSPNTKKGHTLNGSFSLLAYVFKG